MHEYHLNFRTIIIMQKPYMGTECVVKRSGFWKGYVLLWRLLCNIWMIIEQGRATWGDPALHFQSPMGATLANMKNMNIPWSLIPVLLLRVGFGELFHFITKHSWRLPGVEVDSFWTFFFKTEEYPGATKMTFVDALCSWDIEINSRFQIYWLEVGLVFSLGSLETI